MSTCCKVLQWGMTGAVSVGLHCVVITSSVPAAGMGSARRFDCQCSSFHNGESTDGKLGPPGVTNNWDTYNLWSLYSCAVGEMYCAPILAKQEELLSKNIVFIRPPAQHIKLFNVFKFSYLIHYKNMWYLTLLSKFVHRFTLQACSVLK